MFALYSEADDRTRIAAEGGHPIQFPRFITLNKNFDEPPFANNNIGGL